MSSSFRLLMGLLHLYSVYDKMDFLPEMLKYLNVLLRQEHPGSQIYGQTLTIDHHDELIKMGISPSLKGTKVTHKFPFVIFCAPPYGNPDYPGEVRYA